MTNYIKVAADVLSSPFVTILVPVFIIIFGWRLLPLMSAPVRIFVLACLLTVSCYAIFDTHQGRDNTQWSALINRFH
jgi:hypothetical protein